ncbi:MAG: hypothetical protein ACJ8MR_15275 [Povalibacter sp.]
MNSSRTTFLIALLILAGHSSFADETVTSPCAAAPYRQFDFWVGSWEVTEGSGKIAGRNVITSKHQGCAVFEEWKSATGISGTSVNYYDPSTQKWKQIWVSPGALLEMSGGLQGSEMILEGPLQDLKESHTSLLRGVWTPLPDGRVRQHFTESKDGGKTWVEWFDGYYKRSKP